MSKLSSLKQFWEEFNLAHFQDRLDAYATEIAQKQDETSNSRSQLIALLQEFKNSSSDEVKSAASPLIRAFQGEVDKLDARSKYGEKAFFESYKSVAELYDPTTILESAIEKAAKLGSKLQDAEIETSQLRETLADHQGQIVVAKKKEKKLTELQNLLAKYDENIDQAMNERMEEATKKIKMEADEKVRVIEEEKNAAVQRLSDIESKIEADKRQLEVTRSELFDVNQLATEKVDAKTAEVELLLEDLEKANQKVDMLEKEGEHLKEQLSAARANASTGDVGKINEEYEQRIEEADRKISSKEYEIQRLVKKVEKLSNDIEVKEYTSAARIDMLESQKNDHVQQIKELNAKLEKQQDYESIKRDLSILRSLEGDDNIDELGNPEGDSKKPVEVLILERSKALQTENASLRMDKERIGKNLDKLNNDFSEKCSELEKQNGLVKELELHVERLQQIATSTHRGEADGGRSSTDILKELDMLGGSAGHSSKTSSVVLVEECETPDAQSHHMNTKDQEQVQQASYMLPIVQAQKERLRQRNEELEEDQSNKQAQLSCLQAEVKELRSDNVKLYEKIRFLQGYQQSSKTDINKSRSAAINIQNEGLENRYQPQYEQRLDPFRTFSNQERQRRYGELNIIERLILWMVRFMLSNKIARMMVFVYSVLLHGLVFVVLMQMSINRSHMRDIGFEWEEKYMQHMQDHHSNQAHDEGPHG